jgi:hypothetical protein
MEDVKRLCEEIFHSVDEKDWKPLCEHVKKFENGYYDRDERNAWHSITHSEQRMTAVSSKCFQLDYTC